ncbi:multidrug resistance protein norm [Nannochloropsis oceanica]
MRRRRRQRDDGVLGRGLDATARAVRQTHGGNINFLALCAIVWLLPVVKAFCLPSSMPMMTALPRRLLLICQPRTLPPLHGRVDHVWFSDDEDDSSQSPTRVKQGKAEAHTQATICLLEYKKRVSKVKAAATAATTSAAGGGEAVPQAPPLPSALKEACQIEINRLMSSFERVVRLEEEGGEEEGEGGDAPFLFPRGDVEGGGGNRITGLAVTLHGGGSLAWEKNRGSSATAFEVISESGDGGGKYDWLEAAEGEDNEEEESEPGRRREGGGGGRGRERRGEGSWLALPMQWRGFAVGVFFVRVADLPSLSLRQHLRAAARSLSRRLMDTTDMRWHFKEWRQTTSPPSASSSSSSSCVDLVGETEEEEEEGGKEGELVLKAVTSAVTAAAIEEGVQVQATDQRQDLNSVILRLALPLSLSLSLEPLCSAINTYYVGVKMGSRALSAFGLADRIFVLAFFLINFSVATPTTPLVARLRAEGQEDVMYLLMLRLGLGVFVLGICLVPLLQRGAPSLLTLLSGAGRVDNTVFVAATEYFQVRTLSVPAVLLNALAVGALRGCLDTTTPLLVVTTAFLLDYFIQPEWVRWILPSKSLTSTSLPGFGITTVLADYAATLLYIFRLVSLYPSEIMTTSATRFMKWWRRTWRQEKRMKRRQEKERRVFELSEDGEIPVIPLPSSSSRLFSSLRRPRSGSLTPALWKIASQGLSVFTRSILYQIFLLAASSLIIARSGSPSCLAAHQLCMSLWLLPSILLDSLGIVGQGLVADCLGRGRVMRARKVARSLLRYGTVSGVLIGLTYMVGGATTSIPHFLCPDLAIGVQVRPIMWIVSLLVPVTAIVQVGGGILQGAQDFDYQARLMGVCVLISGILLHLTTHGGTVGRSAGGKLFQVWLSLLVFQLLRGLGFAWRFWKDPKCPLSIISIDVAETHSRPFLFQRFRELIHSLRQDHGMAKRHLLPSPGPKPPTVHAADID